MTESEQHQAGILIVGAGAQAKYVCEIIAQQKDDQIACVLASEGSKMMDWSRRYGVETLIGFDHIEKITEQGQVKRVLICMADHEQKLSLARRAEQAGLSLVSAIHPAASIATTAQIGKGVIINAGAVIQPFTTIGEGVMIHANVIVEHDAIVGDYANLAPGVSLAGWVQVGKGATIFTGASIIPGCSIGEKAIVGAGAVVIKDVPAGARVVGTPARSL